MTVPRGTVIGNYRIERPIGTGGSATVYSAHDDRLDTTVAIKVLAENRALEVDARRRFIEEAQNLRKVRSDSVVTVFDVGETNEHQPYMVLEHADRGDLEARIEGLGRPATYSECRHVVSFLHEALSALHRVGLVHRDVKPHNILIRSDPGASGSAGSLVVANERLLLNDLGFAKDLNLASGITVGGGTWAYQAPEQRLSFGTVDHRADIYSATAVLARLLAGVGLAEGQRWSDLLAGMAIAPEARLELLRGVSESPDERHATIDQWRDSIDAVLQPQAQVSGPAPTTMTLPSGSPGGFSAVRKSPALAALGTGALVLAGLAFYAGALFGTGEDQEQQTSSDGAILTTVADIGGHRVSVSGPSEIRVGEPATFVAAVPAGVSASWIYPDGSVLSSGSGVVYTAETEGAFTVSLVVVAPQTPPELVVHEVRAVGQ